MSFPSEIFPASCLLFPLVTQGILASWASSAFHTIPDYHVLARRLVCVTLRHMDSSPRGLPLPFTPSPTTMYWQGFRRASLLFVRVSLSQKIGGLGQSGGGQSNGLIRGLGDSKPFAPVKETHLSNKVFIRPHTVGPPPIYSPNEIVLRYFSASHRQVHTHLFGKRISSQVYFGLTPTGPHPLIRQANWFSNNFRPHADRSTPIYIRYTN